MSAYEPPTEILSSFNASLFPLKNAPQNEYVDLVSPQLIDGVKEFDDNIVANITGNAATVTGINNVGSGSVITGTERTKLNGIEDDADVTDATNVLAAGAVMTTGTQNIGGQKTFTNEKTLFSCMEIDADDNNYSLRNTNIGESTNGSKALYQDQYGQTILNGKVYTQIRCENYDGISVTNGSGSPDDPIVIKGTDGTIRMNGTTTFANTIVGSINGNASSVTNGIYTSSNVTALNDVTSAGSGAIITAGERDKLNDIEDDADVTDATNVLAAGAVMTSGTQNNIAGVKTFTSTIVGSVNGNAETVTGVISGSNVAMGSGTKSQAGSCVAIGASSGQSQAGNNVAIGSSAGILQSGQHNVAIGNSNTGQAQNDSAIAIGRNAGAGVSTNKQGDSAIALGNQCANSNQGNSAVAMGIYAGGTSQGEQAVAIGPQAAQINQGIASTAIGHISGGDSQSGSTTAIGHNANFTGTISAIPAGAVLLNGSGTSFPNYTDNNYTSPGAVDSQTGGLYVRNIRVFSSSYQPANGNFYQLYWSKDSGEIYAIP